MKILLSVYACDPTRGGEFNNGWNYASNAREDREIWCVTTTEGMEGINRVLQDSPLPNLRVVYVKVPDWLYAIKIKSPQIGVYFHYLYWQWKAYLVAKKLDLDVNFDLIHHGTYASLQLGSFLWKLEKPLLFGPVGGGQEAPRKFKKYFQSWWVLELIREGISFCLLKIFKSVTRVIEKAAIVLVVNEDTFGLAEKSRARRIVYSPCTLLPDDFAPSVKPVRNPTDEFRILWVGRLLARKGLLLVLEALARVPDTVNVTLTIIGDGPQANELPRWIEDMGLTYRVNWLGRQPMTEVKIAYAKHDAFVYCSLRESLAAQHFEAMAFGLPQIMLDLHGARTFIPEGVGIKVPATDPEETARAIADAIVFLRNNPDERMRMESRAFESARKFCKSARIQVMNTLYRKVYDEMYPERQLSIKMEEISVAEV